MLVVVFVVERAAALGIDGAAVGGATAWGSDRPSASGSAGGPSGLGGLVLAPGLVLAAALPLVAGGLPVRHVDDLRLLTGRRAALCDLESRGCELCLTGIVRCSSPLV